MAAIQTAIPLLLSLAAHWRPAAAHNPVEVRWSPRPYGTDGPWNVVEMDIGDPEKPQTVPFFPGASFQSFTLSKDLCDKSGSMKCPPFYDAKKSAGKGGSAAEVANRAPNSSYALGLRLSGPGMEMWQDDFWLNDDVFVQDVSMTLMDDIIIEYPEPYGSRYPANVGCLAVGGAEINQTFSRESQDPIYSSIIPGYLWEHDLTESNSFAMHIGSVSPEIPGSLVFGGYDQERVDGDVLVLEGDDYRSEIILVDLGIEVFQGDSPFNFTDKRTGLLAEGDSSYASGLVVHMDGCSPYLTLPSSTCQALSNHLPISYDDDLGLYLWDTTNDSYSRVMNSASGLTFTLTGKQSSDTISVSVPFQHLNLTLDEPLMPDPTSYFPCSTTYVSHYVLGRAFLQDAFVGANWHKKVFWVAQAPGPRERLGKDVVGLDKTETPRKKGDGKWTDTWAGYWGSLERKEGVDYGDDGHGEGGKGGKGNDQEWNRVESGLPINAKIGIGVGAALGTLALVAVAAFFLRRKGNPPPEVQDTVPAQEQYYQNRHYLQPAELQPDTAPSLLTDDASKDHGHETWNAPVEVPATPVVATVCGYRAAGEQEIREGHILYR